MSSVVFVLGVLWGYAPFTAFRPTAVTTPLGSHPPCMDIGIAGNAEWDQFTSAEYDLATETTRDLGIGRVRIGANWAEIERVRGQRDWSALDMRVNHARSAGLSPLLVIQSIPTWVALPTGAVSEHHREVARQFGDFAGEVAERYGDTADGYEIWNEPNLHKFWPNPNVSHYFELLKAAYPAIHAADGRATVITAGLAPAPDGANTIAPLTFLKRLYDLGGRGYSDAIGMHPYSYPELPSGDSDWNTFRSLSEVAHLMETRGDSDKKIWLTEYGAPTGGGSGVSPDMQARMVSEAFELSAAHRSIGPIFIYTLIDGGAPNWDSEAHFGLYYADMTPKPAAGALLNTIIECAPGDSVSENDSGPLTGQPSQGNGGGGTFGS